MPHVLKHDYIEPKAGALCGTVDVGLSSKLSSNVVYTRMFPWQMWVYPIAHHDYQSKPSPEPKIAAKSTIIEITIHIQIEPTGSLYSIRFNPPMDRIKYPPRYTGSDVLFTAASGFWDVRTGGRDGFSVWCRRLQHCSEQCVVWEAHKYTKTLLCLPFHVTCSSWGKIKHRHAVIYSAFWCSHAPAAGILMTSCLHFGRRVSSGCHWNSSGTTDVSDRHQIKSTSGPRQLASTWVFGCNKCFDHLVFIVKGAHNKNP